jgi:hypothetical protein
MPVMISLQHANSVEGEASPLFLALKIEKQRRNSEPFRCSCVHRTVSRLGFPPRTRCRWLIIWRKTAKNSERRHLQFDSLPPALCKWLRVNGSAGMRNSHTALSAPSRDLLSFGWQRKSGRAWASSRSGSDSEPPVSGKRQRPSPAALACRCQALPYHREKPALVVGGRPHVTACVRRQTLSDTVPESSERK